MAAPSQATVVSFMRVVVNAVTAGAANRSRSYPATARLRRTHNLADRCRPGRRSHSRQSAYLRRQRPSHRPTNRRYRPLRRHRVGPRAAPLARCLFAEERCRRGPLAYSSLAGNRRSMALTSSRRRSMSSRRRSMSAWSRSTDRSTPDSRPSTRPMRHATPMTERTTGMLRPRIVPNSAVMAVPPRRRSLYPADQATWASGQHTTAPARLYPRVLNIGLSPEARATAYAT